MELQELKYNSVWAVGNFNEYETWKILYKFIVLQIHQNGNNVRFSQTFGDTIARICMTIWRENCASRFVAKKATVNGHLKNHI
jgi:hypothetical protein